MAVTSKAGISRGIAEGDELVWPEQTTAVNSNSDEKKQRTRIVILTSICELPLCNLPMEVLAADKAGKLPIKNTTTKRYDMEIRQSQRLPKINSAEVARAIIFIQLVSVLVGG